MLEFESYDTKPNDIHIAEPPVTRPLTESSVASRPVWFEELVQHRRHSDEVIVPPETDFNSLQINGGHEQAEKSVSDPLSPSPEEVSLLDSDNDFLALPNSSFREQRRKTIKFLATPDNSDGNKSSSNCSSSEEVSGMRRQSEPNGSLFDTRRNSRSIIGREKTPALPQLSDLVVNDIDQDVDDGSSYDFVIPELPAGRELVIEIRSNWGDEFNVGLNGLEIFDAATCDHAKIEKVT